MWSSSEKHIKIFWKGEALNPELITGGRWTYDQRTIFIYFYSGSSSFLSVGVNRGCVRANWAGVFVAATGGKCTLPREHRKRRRERIEREEILRVLNCWVWAVAESKSDCFARRAFQLFGSCSKVFLLFGLNKQLPTKWSVCFLLFCLKNTQGKKKNNSNFNFFYCCAVYLDSRRPEMELFFAGLFSCVSA